VAKGYRPVLRDHPFLLPPDMRQWLPDSHPVWTLIEAVRLLDTLALHARCRTGRAGRAGYDPDMMLTLLFYAYARGISSSRQIERLCWDDVAFRVICAQDVPDHTTIWRFAEMSPELVGGLFAQVLTLCAKAGMVKLDTITLDGTKVTANASKSVNRSEEHIRAELQRRAQEAVDRHRSTDAQENALFGVGVRGDELPAELTDPRQRGKRLQRALDDLEREREAEQAERAEQAQEHLDRAREGTTGRGAVPAEVRVVAAEARLARLIAAQQAKIDDWERRNAECIAAGGTGLVGSRPQPVGEHFAVVRARASLAKALAWQAERERKKQEQQPAAPVRNITDPDSRLMPTRSGFVQGYNAQNVVSKDLYIVATEVTQQTGDAEQWVPMMSQAQKAADLITTVHSGQAQAAGEVCTCPTEHDGDDHDDDPHAAGPDGDVAQDRPACPVHPNGIGTAVGDAGYLSRRNLTADGPDRLIATGKRRNVEKAAHTTPEQPTQQPATGDGDRDGEPDPIEAMAERLRTPEAMAIYRQRGHIAETPHGHIKHNMGIRAFARRGLTRVRAEWMLVCTVYNLDRLLRTLRTAGRQLPATA
jgi:transposase